MKIVRKKFRVPLSGVGYILISVLLLFVSSLPLLSNGDRSILDPLRTKNMAHDAVIIGIDDATLQSLGAWPLDRKVFADLVEKLKGYGINGLVFDVLFLEPKENDTAVSLALEKAEFPIVIAGKLVGGKMMHSVYPLLANSREGYVNVTPDSDGKVRDSSSPVMTEGECRVPISLQMISDTSCIDKKQGRFIYPDDIPLFSLVDVIQGDSLRTSLEGKVLFVGATTLDLEDYFVGLGGNKIPGVYIHAAMYASSKSGLHTMPLIGIEKNLLLIIIMVCGWCIVFSVRNSLTQILLLLLSVCIIVIATVIVFDVVSIEIPMLSALMALISFFVMATVVRYAHSRKENLLVKMLFSRYVNKEVLESLLKSNSFQKEGERRQLSILFSDLRGFTDFSETLSPEDLTRLLNGYFASMVSEIFKEGGTVDKFIGDAVMAFWNAPLAVKNHELHATLAAIGMQEALLLFNKKHGTHLKMGIGIHTGEAVVGNIGGEERVSYTALGDSVNTASRIESLSKKYGVAILVSEEVKNAIETSLDNVQGWNIRKIDHVYLKGKQKSNILFEITKTDTKVINLYEEAFTFYQKKDYKSALVILRSDTLFNDSPSKVLRERIEEGSFLEDFNGIWKLETK